MIWSVLGRILADFFLILADFSRDSPIFAENSDFSRDFASKPREFFDKIKVADRTCSSSVNMFCSFEGSSSSGREFWWEFGPPPINVEDPHPTGKCPDARVCLCAPFSCLRKNLGDPILTPTPNPRTPYQGFVSATRSWMDILTKENLVGAKIAPTAISRTFTRLVRENRLLTKDSLLPPLGTDKVPKRNCVTKILPHARVNFPVRFASKPLFYGVMTR